MESDRGQSAAVSAVVAMARITGQIIDRREVGDPGAFDGKTDEELMEEARNRAAALGLLSPETQNWRMAINAEWVKGTVTSSLGLVDSGLVEDDNS